MDVSLTDPRGGGAADHGGTAGAGGAAHIVWMSTAEAAARLGITVRTLYRLIDEGELAAYKFGRVIRLQAADVDAFIQAARIPPGSLEHLYPEVKRATSEIDQSGT